MPTRFSSAVPVIAAIAVPALISTAARADDLKVGSPAPTITVAKWVKGQPIKIEKGKIYVVEFWATWCGPCKQSIPHLTELAKKYKGKVTFTGISISEEKKGPTDTTYIPKVAKFVTDMGAKMDYNVGVDGPTGVMSKTWMDAAGQDGIPTAFVIGKDGKVAWIGHPMDGLDKVLDGVISGKFDAKAEAARKEKAEAGMNELRQGMQKVNQLAQQGKFAEAVTALDAVKSDDPTVQKGLAQTKFQLLIRSDEAAALKFAKEVSTGLLKDDAMPLNNIAWAIVDPEAKLMAPDYDLALSMAQRAAELTKNEDATILDTLSTAYWRKGDLDKAIATQEKAVSLAAKSTDIPEETKKELQTRLETFKKQKADK